MCGAEKNAVRQPRPAGFTDVLRSDSNPRLPGGDQGDVLFPLNTLHLCAIPCSSEEKSPLRLTLSQFHRCHRNHTRCIATNILHFFAFVPWHQKEQHGCFCVCICAANADRGVGYRRDWPMWRRRCNKPMPKPGQPLKSLSAPCRHDSKRDA